MHAQDPERRIEERRLQHGHSPWGVISCFLSLMSVHVLEQKSQKVFAIGHALARKTETESEKLPPRGDGHAAIPSPLFSSQDLGHACTRAWREFKPPDPGLEPRSTTWESSDITIRPTAGPRFLYLIAKRDLTNT